MVKYLRQFHLIVPILLIITICLASFLLWLEMRQALKPDEHRVMLASLIEKKNLVQRKFSDRLLWLEIEVKSSLFAEDHVRTGEDSQATIVFKDGTIIRLYEHSLIIITEHKEGAILELMQGRMDVIAESANGSNLLIKFKEKIFSIITSPLLASFSVDEQTISVKKGVMGIRDTLDDKTSEQRIEENSVVNLSKKLTESDSESAELQKKGAEKSEELTKANQNSTAEEEIVEVDNQAVSDNSVKLSSPTDGEVVTLSDTNKVIFKWIPVGNASYYVFEMKGQKAKKGIQKTVYEPTVSLLLSELNKYQWRVVAFTEKKKKIATSNFRNVSVVGKQPLPAPLLQTPEQKD